MSRAHGARPGGEGGACPAAVEGNVSPWSVPMPSARRLSNQRFHGEVECVPGAWPDVASPRLAWRCRGGLRCAVQHLGRRGIKRHERSKAARCGVTSASCTAGDGCPRPRTLSLVASRRRARPAGGGDGATAGRQRGAGSHRLARQQQACTGMRRDPERNGSRGRPSEAVRARHDMWLGSGSWGCGRKRGRAGRRSMEGVVVAPRGCACL